MISRISRVVGGGGAGGARGGARIGVRFGRGRKDRLVPGHGWADAI